MTESSLNTALRHFEAVEANLAKAELVLREIKGAIPNDISFGDTNPEYEASCLTFEALFASLPKIDGWKPDISLMDLDEIAQTRFDARDVGEIECMIAVEKRIDEPSRQLREYRYRFNQKRRELIRDALVKLIDAIDANLREFEKSCDPDVPVSKKFDGAWLDLLKGNIAEVDTLLGSSVPRPHRWSDLYRHLHFGMVGDILDIIQNDWPAVKAGITKTLYGEREPVPVGVEDIGDLVSKGPSGPVATKLQWERLTDEDFERLLFALISGEAGYENPQWLMKTRAPDRGRDLSVYRIHEDPLAGRQRKRVIIQCRHRLTSSVAPVDIATLKEQVRHWEPPRVDVLVVATSGRFTADAVALVERHNQADVALMIEMWPESHLERLLASRPAMIAEFGLR